MAQDARDIELRKARREQELVARTQTLAYWKQRDSRKIEQLKAIWAERDAQMAPIRRQQVFDCICSLCGHPYLMRRPPAANDAMRCPTCRKFIRLQRVRIRYRQRMADQRMADQHAANQHDPDPRNPSRNPPRARGHAKGSKNASLSRKTTTENISNGAPLTNSEAATRPILPQQSSPRAKPAHTNHGPVVVWSPSKD